MTCETVRENFCEYLDDLLEGTQKKHVEQHLASCQPCSQEVEELRQTMDWVKQADDVTPPAGLRMAVLRELKVEQEQSRRRRFAPGFGQAIAAAAVFVLLVAGNLIPLQSSSADYDAAPIGILTTESLPAQDDSNQLETFSVEQSTDSQINRTLDAADLEKSAPTASAPPVTISPTVRLLINLTLLPLFAFLCFLAVKKRREPIL